MMRVFTFGAGLAAGYIFGTKAGRERYEQLKSQAQKVWQSPRTQEKIAGAKDSVKEVVPEVKERLQSAMHRTGTTSTPTPELDPESGTANSYLPGQAGAGSTGTAPEADPGTDTSIR
jgi:hypothetical protein